MAKTKERTPAQVAYDQGKAKGPETATNHCPYTGQAGTDAAYLRDCWFAGAHGEPMPAAPKVKVA